jgi:hypothetical protein
MIRAARGAVSVRKPTLQELEFANAIMTSEFNKVEANEEGLKRL